MSKLNKNIINNIDARYIKEIEAIIKTAPELDVKYKIIEDISDRYFYEVGEMLPSYLINLLADWFLSAELKSKNVDKISRTEYPILSVHQIKRRVKKHPILEAEALDYLNQTRGRKTKKITKEKESI